MSRAVDKARKDAQKARAELARWENQATALTADRARLEASMEDEATAAQLLEDPAAVERIAQDVARQEAQTRLTATAITAAGKRVTEALLAVCAAEADDEDAQAATIERQRDDLAAKVEIARRALEELDGATWAREEDIFERFHLEAHLLQAGGGTRTVTTSKVDLLDGDAWAHRRRAAVARYVAEHQTVPQFWHELPGGLGSGQISDGSVYTDGVRDLLNLPKFESVAPISLDAIRRVQSSPQVPVTTSSGMRL